MVPETGIEPARGISSRDFKSRASASSATPANLLHSIDGHCHLPRIILYHKTFGLSIRFLFFAKNIFVFFFFSKKQYKFSSVLVKRDLYRFSVFIVIIRSETDAFEYLGYVVKAVCYPVGGVSVTSDGYHASTESKIPL